jgi:predicted RecB family nuclease
LEPDADSAFINFAIRTDGAGTKWICNPLQKENIMKKDDLTQVKHIGALRMKMLIRSGITTIRQLHQISLEKLAQVKTIGPHYAKLIKAAVAESYGEKPVKSAPKVPKTVSAKKKNVADLNQNLRKQIKVLGKRLKQANEKLKPLDKKKYLELYVDFKKRSKTLKAYLGRLNKNPAELSQKATKKIIKNADALSATLKNVGKKPKKKTYRLVSQEIQSFSKMLKKTQP